MVSRGGVEGQTRECWPGSVIIEFIDFDSLIGVPVRAADIVATRIGTPFSYADRTMEPWGGVGDPLALSCSVRSFTDGFTHV